MRLHTFDDDISAVVLPAEFTFPFCYKPHPLVLKAAEQLRKYVEGKTEWHAELSAGKMFGVLVVSDPSGQIGFLAAFSGNLAHSNNHAYFVPAVYDLLDKEAYFVKEEAEISGINREIERLMNSESWQDARSELEAAERQERAEVDRFADFLKTEKERRARLRDGASPETVKALDDESRFQSAEFRRLKKNLRTAVETAAEKVASLERQVEGLRQERKQRSVALQKWIFDRFEMLNAKGGQCSLTDIFATERGELPPAGAGECAAPKLLQYAYLHRLQPLAMGEFWWGRSPVGEIRRHGEFYPSCKEKCEPILHFMMQGLRVEKSPLSFSEGAELEPATLYEDAYYWIVDKPAGMLSVPGKEGGRSLLELARERCGEAYEVHRLDMHTSGVLAIAKTEEAQRALRRLFEERKVQKVYVALLEGYAGSDKGAVQLPLAPDYVNRPQQKVDYKEGKEAITRYQVVSHNSDGTTRILFYPLTGRTHQLRVHAAHPDGLNAPIKGDMLYGHHADRLYLHASMLIFRHPFSGKSLKIVSKPAF